MTTMTKRHIRTYTELMSLSTYEERYEYLRLNGNVGDSTFGFDRYLNQKLYKSVEWKRVRDYVIMRDNGCDLGMDDYDILGVIHVHHMNPISTHDITESTDYLFNPEYLICVSVDTHNAIHYGSSNYVRDNILVERTPNDHCPWKIKK